MKRQLKKYQSKTFIILLPRYSSTQLDLFIVVFFLLLSINWAGSSRGREDDEEKVNEKDAPFGDIIVEISHYLCCFISTRLAIKWNSVTTWHPRSFSHNSVAMTTTQAQHTLRTRNTSRWIYTCSILALILFVHSWKINIPVLGVIKRRSGYIWRLFHA